MNTTDPRLKDLFDEHSGRVHVVGDLAERAIARDRANRRREVTTAVAVGALALAVAVPIGWNSLRPVTHQVPAGTSTAPTPAPSTQTGATATNPTPSTSSGSASDSATPTAIPTIIASGDPAPVQLTPATGSVTGQTNAGYVVDGVFHEGDRTIPLPDELRRSGHVLRVGDGLLAFKPADGRSYVLVDSSGAIVKEIPAGGVRVAPDRQHFLISTLGGDLAYYDATGTKLGQLDASTCECTTDGAGGGYIPAGLVGTTAYGVAMDGRTTVAWDVTTDQLERIKGSVSLVGPAGTGLVTWPGRTPQKLEDWCQELRDLGTGATLWRLCGPILLTSFSEDGTHLVGTGVIDGLPDALLDDGKFRYPSLVVLDASTGEIVAEGGSRDPAVGGSFVTAHLGEGGVLTAQVNGTDGLRSLQVCSLDGSCAVAGEAKPLWTADIPEGNDPYVLTTN
ncbi:hypothetical protein OO014_02655 [Intrasporangium calvum]|uniref:Uncharacterized protein n=1 Tax=Intrasporangium calvum TaxID=53358 RepID=A0ABT5GD41_9MICO|nr:hypothetical protein [Intrasporangium calvum]MDC5696143.1 hypothetical protein [Intrasporangium calvum]